MDILIRPALIKDSTILTAISFASKRYWNYPDCYFDSWKDELTITPSYIKDNLVYVAETKGQVIGYFSLVEVRHDFWAGKVFVKKGFWLEHIFVLPEYIGKGIGTQMMEYLISICKSKDVGRVRIFSDPNAKGFYDKIGANYTGESPSSIAGRTVSLYELDI
ncbi:MAG: GNAT family N-acetyltransferase [Bacillota bacterium]